MLICFERLYDKLTLLLNGKDERDKMKTVLITGASSGIGKATAIYFSEHGWNVAATFRSVDNTWEFSQRKNIATFPLDVTDIESVELCIEQVLERFGRIDVLINNAGVYTTAPLELNDECDIARIINTNIIGTLTMTKAILGHFRENKSGTIVNISSIAGRVTFPFQTVYHTSKWAIEGMSESLHYELAPVNIKVKVVEPGMVKTDLYRSTMNRSFEHYPVDYQNRFKNWYHFLMDHYDKSYDPLLDAKTIYRATTDNRSKLRYSSDLNTQLILFLRSILCLSTFQYIIKKITKLNNLSKFQ